MHMGTNTAWPREKLLNVKLDHGYAVCNVVLDHGCK